MSKLIVDYDGVKRELGQSFNMIGDAYVLRDIAQQILQQVGEHDSAPFVYGYVYIREAHPMAASTSPIGWKDGA